MYFITAIIGKETLEKLPQYKQLNSRTFGFYEHFWDAQRAVDENRGNMQECLYDYIVIESIEEGVHPLVIHESWFKWNEEKRAWIDMEERPPEYVAITNWALG